MKIITKKKTMIAAVLITAIAVLGLSFVGAFASPLPAAVSSTPNTMISMPPTAIPIRSNWVRIDGNITSWRTQQVKGALTLMAATTSINGVPAKWFNSADALWTNTTNTRANGNISISYYTARLVNTNFTMINYQGNDYYLNGTWNVNNVTVTRTVIKTDGSVNIQSNTQITRLETKVYGELNVTGSWTQFTLQISGIPLLSGTVHRSIERQTVFNRFDIINGGTATIVTKATLTTIERNYGAVPGMPNYDESMDFHGTYRIDICDISTVAANVQS